MCFFLLLCRKYAERWFEVVFSGSGGPDLVDKGQEALRRKLELAFREGEGTFRTKDWSLEPLPV
jgi:hypothetical protein